MSDSWLIVIPSINPAAASACYDSLPDDADGRWMELIVDNTVTNHGVAGAWNLGIDQMFRSKFDWLVICSESVRFGVGGAKDIQCALDAATPGTMAVEADEGLGWHLIAFRKEVFEKVGYFDELFWPAYYEDNDFSYRYQLAFKTTEEGYPLWPKVHIDATLIGKAQGLAHVREPIDFMALEAAYVKKWGGVSPNETYDRPYNNPMLSYRYAQRIKR